MLFQVQSYLRFLWNSSNEHGVHSPFVFDLVTKCFYDRKPKPDYDTLKSFRKSLLQNRDDIEVKDFGAGSKVFKSSKRQIAKIAKTAGINPKRAKLLFKIVQYFKPKSILELGTSLGLASSALSIGGPFSRIVTLEGCPQTAKTAQQQFEKFGLSNIETVIGEFENGLSELKNANFDMVYFDGNHQKEATLNYFELLLPTINNNSLWIFDDIHWSAEMEEAWQIIKKNPKVTVTIDTFQWGLVFFRKEQEKEHFVIRT